MKYFFLISLILTVFKVCEAANNKHKNQDKSKLKNKSNKDGPLTWNTLAYDGVLEGLLKNEKKEGSVSNNVKNLSNYNQYNASMMNQIQTGKPAFITTNTKLLSENQKSKTFRTVSPLEDSTKTNQGQKYSTLFKRTANTRGRNTHTGYYGSSRLTR